MDIFRAMVKPVLDARKELSQREVLALIYWHHQQQPVQSLLAGYLPLFRRNYGGRTGQILTALVAVLTAAANAQSVDSSKELTTYFSPLVVEEVVRMAGRIPAEEISDALQEGFEAVWDAVRTYDPGKAVVRPSLWVRVAVQYALSRWREGNHLLKVSSKNLEALNKLRGVRNRLESELKEPPTASQVAEAMGITLAALADLEQLEMALVGNSLDRETEEGTPYFEFVEGGTNPADVYEAKDQGAQHNTSQIQTWLVQEALADTRLDSHRKTLKDYMYTRVEPSDKNALSAAQAALKEVYLEYVATHAQYL